MCNNSVAGENKKLSEESCKRILEYRKLFPEDHPDSAVLSALHIAQEQFGYVPEQARKEIAGLLDMQPGEVEQVMSFYRMYFNKPVGKYVVKVCDSISCYLRGSDELLELGAKKLGIKVGETTPDGQISLFKIECLASCGNGPCAQVNDEFVYDLTPENFEEMLEKLKTARENPFYIP